MASRQLESLQLGAESGHGHSLESLDPAPGSQPLWTAQNENGVGEGLSCINCHQPHGSIDLTHPTGSQFRNLRDDVGYGSGLWVTYNHGSPGVNDLSRDLIDRCLEILEPDAPAKKLNAAPSLCNRMNSSTGSNTIDSNCSKLSMTSSFVH